MDSRTRTPSRAPSPTANCKQASSSMPDKISAYYSLVFPFFTYYIQTLCVTIGRRCTANPNAATSSTVEVAPVPVPVDVDLGAVKSVSRLHAKIEYDQDEDRFVLTVLGRNGAWVDGVWCGSGHRAPLGERSRIQIASRTFDFVLPPPPPHTEDMPSPSSESSMANRQRSPSVDITSISPPSSQPSNSPPPHVKVKLQVPPGRRPPPPPPPQLPNSNAIGESSRAQKARKRKKGEAPLPLLEKRRPEDMPPKPPLTYALLIYRAIKAIGGKATLQEICTWISTTHEYYRYADTAWMSSVRHNLSSGRAFAKMERCGGDRGKGFFWSVDENHAQQLEEQETKSQQSAAASAEQPNTPGGGKGAVAKGSRKKDKSASHLDPPLKRSVRGDFKGGVLPPPLTSAPRVLTTATTSTSTSPPLTVPTVTGGVSATTQATTGIFAYPTHPQQVHMVSAQSAPPPSAFTSTPLSSSNPYAALAQPGNWGLNVHTPTTASPSPTPPGPVRPSGSATSATPNIPVEWATAPVPPAGAATSSVPDVVIPIVLGPIPPSHSEYAPGHPNNSAKEGYMVLHERTLILDPDVFSELTQPMLTELEKMGARAALVVLTGHMIRALKERRAKGRGKDRAGRKGKGGGRGSTTRQKSAAGIGAPFTKVPLENRVAVAMGGGDATMEVKPGTQPQSSPTRGSGSGDQDPGTPIVDVVDESEDGEPAAKKRKIEEMATGSVS